MPPPPSRRFPPMSTMAKKSVPQITLDLSTSSSVSSTPQSSIHAQGFEGAEQPASPGTIVTPFSVAPIATPATGQCFGEVDFGPVVRTQQPVPLAHHGAAAAVLRPAAGGINAAMEPADSPKPPAERFPRKDVLKVIDETSKATIQILRVDCDAARNSKKWVTLKDTPCVIEKVIRDTVKAKKEKEMVKRGMNHPNLVKYYGSESHRSGALTIFVEFVNLGSLRDLSTQWRQPSATGPSIRAPTLLERLVVARAVARQALHGLMYYHLVEGMFHRDIKPDNLLVNDAGRLKLCDFDASKKADEWGVTIDGTMTYMAPEVVLQVSDKCTDRMDVWSLGLVLLELLAGKHPFHGVPMSKLLTAEAMGRIVHEELNELSFPDTAKDLIRKCLTTNPCDRISCAQALQHPFLKTTWTEFIDEISASHGGTEEDAATCRELKTHWSTRLNTADPNAVTLATKFGVEVDSAYPELELSTWKSVRRTPPAAEDAGSWKGKIDNVMRRIIHERQRWCEGALAVVLKRLGHRPSSPLVSASATSHPLCCPPVAA